MGPANSTIQSLIAVAIVKPARHGAPPGESGNLKARPGPPRVWSPDPARNSQGSPLAQRRELTTRLINCWSGRWALRRPGAAGAVRLDGEVGRAGATEHRACRVLFLYPSLVSRCFPHFPSLAHSYDCHCFHVMSSSEAFTSQAFLGHARRCDEAGATLGRARAHN